MSVRTSERQFWYSKPTVIKQYIKASDADRVNCLSRQDGCHCVKFYIRSVGRVDFGCNNNRMLTNANDSQNQKYVTGSINK